MRSGQQSQKPVGVILAGGRSTRMGVEKSFIKLAGVSLLQRGIDRFGGQVRALVLNANGDIERFTDCHLPVITDRPGGQLGPLAGILAGMKWSNQTCPKASHIATIASDTPFFPADFVARLCQALEDKADARRADEPRGRFIVIPASQDRLHPAFGLWPVVLAADLEAWLVSGERRVQSWLQRHEVIVVEFDLVKRKNRQIDPFFNINTPADLQIAENWCAQSKN